MVLSIRSLTQVRSFVVPWFYVTPQSVITSPASYCLFPLLWRRNEIQVIREEQIIFGPKCNYNPECCWWWLAWRETSSARPGKCMWYGWWGQVWPRTGDLGVERNCRSFHASNRATLYSDLSTIDFPRNLWGRGVFSIYILSGDITIRRQRQSWRG